MLKRILLFPNSKYLRERWWHRLATVIFWAWLIAVLGYSLNWLVLRPYQQCIDAKYGSYGGPSDLDCGSNHFGYALTNASNESLASAAFTVGMVAVFLFLWLVIPSVVYRLILYVAVANKWKDGGGGT